MLELLVIGIIVIVGFVVFPRLNDLRRRLAKLESSANVATHAAALRDLNDRISDLEGILRDRSSRPTQHPLPPTERVDSAGVDAAVKPPLTDKELGTLGGAIDAGKPRPQMPHIRECPRCGLVVLAHASECESCGFVFDELRPEAESLIQPMPSMSRPTAATRELISYTPTNALADVMRFVRERMAGEEWETIIGGSWLNRLGILVLIIGLSLFLGYSITQLGPQGQLAIGFLLSVAMLVGGVILERRARYLIFGRGLIGGGWAGLYFTTYAAHGLESTRVIRDPVLATGLLAAVAIGMIVHSIRYRSETVTGVAYFVAFATLAITPLSKFGLVASLPLTASLLYVAHRFSWDRMAVAGVVVVYAGYVWGSSGALSSRASFLAGQAALAAYWVLFESLDLIELAKGRARRGAALALAPLNACGFIGVSLLQWTEFAAINLYWFLSYAAVAFLVTAVLRWRIRPPSTLAPTEGALERTAFGSYEGAVTIAAALAVAAISDRFSGAALNVALLLEAEFLILAGIRLGQPYLLNLGAIAFALAAGKLVMHDAPLGGEVNFAGFALSSWTPVATLTALTSYLNRSLLREGRAYGWIGSLIVALILSAEVSPAFLGLAWLVLGGFLFELGLLWRDADFRMQSYVAASLGFALLATINAIGVPGLSNPHPWISLGLGALLGYGAWAQLLLSSGSEVPQDERITACDCALLGGTTLAMFLAWHALPAPVVAVAWMMLAVVLIEGGLVFPLRTLRLQGYAVATIAFSRLFLANFTTAGYSAFVSHRVLTVAPVIGAFYYLAQKFKAERSRIPLGGFETVIDRVCLYAATALVVVLIRFEAGRVMAVVGWAVLDLALLILALRLHNRDLRYQSYFIAILTFARSWATNFYVPESLAGVSARVATGSIVITCLYAAQFLSPRAPHATPETEASMWRKWLARVDSNPRVLFSLLATALLTMLLYYEVSGGLLTIAWGLQAVALLSAGFALRERVLRLAGLALLGTCILKVFTHDLRELEALPRILSFIVLGALLLAVSFVYTRFREQLRRIL